MSIPNIIAIDGPAASGKSTLAQHLARELGYLYFDTGVMYRALTWVGLRRGFAMEDEEQLTRLAQDLEIDVRPPSASDGRAYDVWADGKDVTWDIRRQEVDANVSVVSAYAGVRAALSAQQRRIGLRGRVVMVGRDIGTVVLPQADLKIFLDATAEERARRRYQELMARHEQASYEAILQAMQQRDRIDSTRDVAPLRAAEDAVILDTDRMDAGQVLEAARKLVFKESTPGYV
jgi:CMP/dCMP kinase